MITLRGDVMKKISALILSLCAFAAVFLSFWYNDVLFNRLFVFGLIPMALSVLLLFGSLIMSIIVIARKPSILKSYLPIVISIITVLIIFVFPFRKAKVNLELQLFDKARMHVIEMVKNDEIIPDRIGNAELPFGFRHISSDGNIFIYQNDEEQVISFWVFRGMFSGSVQLIYSSKDENLIYDNEEGHSIVSIEELKDHWYLVETDY
jgi:hypothetical protein